MIRPSTISSQEVLPLSQNFAGLKELGLNLLPQLAGEFWTDYNEHDPGVTILEALCYAITELGYRSSFEVRDLLTQPDGSIPFEDNALFAPPEIFPTHAWTIQDFQRILCDRIPEIRMAWFTPQVSPYIEQSVADSVPKGLYQVTVEPKELLDASQETSLMQQLKVVLEGSRNLGETFDDIQILEPAQFCLTGTVELVPHVDPNEVYAQLIFAVQQALSPAIPYQGLHALMAAGYATDQLYEGPLLNQGMLAPDLVFQDRITKLSISWLSDILYQVPGVEQISGLAIKWSGDAKVIISDTEGDQILLNPTYYPRVRLICQGAKKGYQIELDRIFPLGSHLVSPLREAFLAIVSNMHGLVGQVYLGEDQFWEAMPTQHAEMSPEVQRVFEEFLELSHQLYLEDHPNDPPAGPDIPLSITQSGQNIPLDLVKVTQSYQALLRTEARAQSQALADDEWAPFLPKGRFQEVVSYYSIQHHFPSLYGLAKDDIPPDASPLRKAQVRQLKGYLLAFEQLLANFLAQLAKLSVFFSTQPDSRTYFFQPLYEVPNVSEVLKDFFSPALQDLSPTDYHRVWKAFQQEESNGYYQGLRQRVREQEPFLDRKSRILAHLLARFAEELPSFVPGQALSPEISSAWLQDFPYASQNRSRAETPVSAEGRILPLALSSVMMELLALSFASWVLGRQHTAKLMLARGLVSGLQYFFNQRFNRYNWDGFQVTSLFVPPDPLPSPYTSWEELEGDILQYGSEKSQYEILESGDQWQVRLHIPHPLSDADSPAYSLWLPPVYANTVPGSGADLRSQASYLDGEEAESYIEFVIHLLQMMPKSPPPSSEPMLPAEYPGRLQGMYVIEHILLWQGSLPTGMDLRFFTSQISLVIPSFSDLDPLAQPTYQSFVKETLQARIPAHLKPNFIFQSASELTADSFEQMYASYLQLEPSALGSNPASLRRDAANLTAWLQSKLNG